MPQRRGGRGSLGGMRSLIVALLLLSPACAHTTDHRADVCPESASLHCLTAPEDVVVHELLYRPMVETNF